MFAKISFYRAIAVLACVVWGINEMVALQRARWRKLHLVSQQSKEIPCSGNT